MTIETQNYINDINLFEKKIGIIVGARVRDKNKISNAVKMQDSIRLKIKSWHGSEEIKKWRQKRT